MGHSQIRSPDATLKENCLHVEAEKAVRSLPPGLLLPRVDGNGKG